MSVHSWKQLAEWSIEYSCLNDTEKAAAMEIFKEEWEEFCNEVVKKYSTVAVECGVQAWEDINN
jgi:adenosine deaminase CECR1